jgi:hypothetical protein
MTSRYGNTYKKLQEQQKLYQDEWSKYYWNEFVLKNLDKNWDWYWLSTNPNITWDIVKANLDKPWDWYGLSTNPNITWDIVISNPDKPWNWRGLSSNPNITMDIIEANPDKPWNWYGLSNNPFTKEKEMFMERKMQEHNAAFKIQTYWRRANYNPQYELCKRRLIRECEVFGFQ